MGERSANRKGRPFIMRHPVPARVICGTTCSMDVFTLAPKQVPEESADLCTRIVLNYVPSSTHHVVLISYAAVICKHHLKGLVVTPVIRPGFLFLGSAIRRICPSGLPRAPPRSKMPSFGGANLSGSLSSAGDPAARRRAEKVLIDKTHAS